MDLLDEMNRMMRQEIRGGKLLSDLTPEERKACVELAHTIGPILQQQKNKVVIPVLCRLLDGIVQVLDDPSQVAELHADAESLLMLYMHREADKRFTSQQMSEAVEKKMVERELLDSTDNSPNKTIN